MNQESLLEYHNNLIKTLNISSYNIHSIFKKKREQGDVNFYIFLDSEFVELKNGVTISCSLTAYKFYSSKEKLSLEEILLLENEGFVDLEVAMFLSYNKSIELFYLEKSIFSSTHVNSDDLLSNKNIKLFFKNTINFISSLDTKKVKREWNIYFYTFFGVDTPEFMYFNEIISLSNNIKYSGSEKKFTKLELKLNNIFIKFIELSNILPITLEELDSQLKLKNFFNKNACIIHKEEDLIQYKNDTSLLLEKIKNNSEIKLKSIIIFFLNNLDTWSQHDTLLKLFLLQSSSLSEFSLIFFNYYLNLNGLTLKVDYSQEELTIFKAANMSGIFNLEENNVSKKWDVFLETTTRFENWNDLKLFLEDTEELYEYDFIRAFTAASLDAFQAEGYFEENYNIYEDLLSETDGFILCSIFYKKKDINIKNNYLPQREVFNRSVNYNTGDKYGWWRLKEVKQVLLNDDNIDVTIGRVYLFKNKQFILKNFVENIINFQKQQFSNLLLNKQVKKILNNLFGLFFYKKKKYKISVKKENENELNMLANSTKITHYRVKKILSDDEKNVCELVLDIVENEQYPLGILINTIISSNNSFNLRKKIFKYKNEISNFKLYLTHIDSIWINQKLPDSETSDDKIGTFRLKKKSKMLFFQKKLFLNLSDQFLFFQNKKISDFYLFKKIVQQNLLKFKKPEESFVDFSKRYVSFTKNAENKFNKKLANQVKIINKTPESSTSKLLKELNSIKNYWYLTKTNAYKLNKFLYIKIINKQNNQNIEFYSISVRIVDEDFNSPQKFTSLYAKLDAIIHNFFQNYDDISLWEINLTFRLFDNTSLELLELQEINIYDFYI